MVIGMRVDVVGSAGRGDEIRSVFGEMAAQVREYEPGCLRYDVGRSREQPDDFVIWEIYADQEAFDQHRLTVHFERLMDGLLPTLVQDRRRILYDIVS